MLPLRILASSPDGDQPANLAVMVAFALATLGPVTMLVYAQCALAPQWWRRAWQLPSILVLGVGVAFSTSMAVLGAFRGGRREFVRTPKFGIDAGAGSWRRKAYGERAIWSGLVEMALGAYCATTAWIFWRDGAHGVLPFLGLYAAGFLTVGWLTVVQSMALGAPWGGWLRRVLPASAPGRMGRAASIVALIGACAAPAAADPWTRLVSEGERLWTHSPDPTNPVACATCHHDTGEVSRWAASFPKFKPGPPSHARVMTLWQANVEAVKLHYREPAPQHAATAITVYLTAQSAGRAIAPGLVAERPVFEARMVALAESVARGERHYASRCARCHAPGAAATAAVDLPRQIRVRGEPTEAFLERHATGGRRLAWDAAAVADVMAYLVGLRAGRALEPVSANFAREAQR
jgi:cytochrome c553